MPIFKPTGGASPLSTKGDLYTRSTADARLAVGSNGQYLTADSSQATGLKWATISSSPLLAYRSVTTTDSPTNADDVLVCSGSSFTINLFTAVGNTGKVLRIKHNGTSLSQNYTLDGNSTETIGGSATYVLYTNGEILTIVSDGANWQVIDHYTFTDWSSTTTITVTGSSSNPTKGTGTVVDSIQWRRRGAMAQIRWRLGWTVGGADGSGVYIFALPSGLTADTTLYEVYTGTNIYQASRCVLPETSGGGRSNTSISKNYMHYLYSTTQFAYLFDVTGAAFIQASTGHGYSATTIDNYGTFSVPISGWKD